MSDKTCRYKNCPEHFIRDNYPPCHSEGAGCWGIHDDSYGIDGSDNLEPECRRFVEKQKNHQQGLL